MIINQLWVKHIQIQSITSQTDPQSIESISCFELKALNKSIMPAMSITSEYVRDNRIS